MSARCLILWIFLLAAVLTACTNAESPAASQSQGTQEPGGSASSAEEPDVDSVANATELLRVDGHGDKVIEDFAIPEGIHRLKLTHDGERNFIVKDKSAGGDTLLINQIGSYRGSIPLNGGHDAAIEVNADGAWTLIIETLGDINGYAFSQQGDYVSGVFLGTEGENTISFRHAGEDSFVVRLHSAIGSELIVNRFGDVNQEMYFEFLPGAEYFWEVEADGDWAIE